MILGNLKTIFKRYSCEAIHGLNENSQLYAFTFLPYKKFTTIKIIKISKIDINNDDINTISSCMLRLHTLSEMS